MGRAAISVLLIAALPAAAADGGTDAGFIDAADPIYRECPAGPPPEQLGDGSWKLAPARAARNVCLLVTCDEARRQLAAAPAAAGFFSTANLFTDLLIWALGLAGGIYLGFTLRGAFK